MRHCHALVMLLLVLSWATVGLAQTHSSTKDDVAEEMRRIYAALDSGKPEAILQTPNEGVGFGWRAAAPRSTQWTGLSFQDVTAQGADAYRQAIKRFLDSMEYWHIKLEELHTLVDGDVGLAWGVHVEDFKIKGRLAESANRVGDPHVG